jgi:hypothetical protein
VNGRQQQRVEALENCVGKLPRGTPEQVEAQRAYADARRCAYFTALTQAIERGEAEIFKFEYPDYPGEWIPEPIDERSAAAVRRVIEYIDASIKSRRAGADRALSRWDPEEATEEPEWTKLSEEERRLVGNQAPTVERLAESKPTAKTPELPISEPVRGGIGRRRRVHPFAEIS